MTTILTQTIARLLLLPILVIAVAVMVKGYTDVGDGFSAGVIAALGVLLQYVACSRQYGERLMPIGVAQRSAFLGLFLVFLVAFVPLLLGQPLLSHSPAPGQKVIHLGTLELHTAIVFDLGVFLLVFGFALTVINAIAQCRDKEGGQA